MFGCLAWIACVVWSRIVIKIDICNQYKEADVSLIMFNVNLNKLYTSLTPILYCFQMSILITLFEQTFIHTKQTIQPDP